MMWLKACPRCKGDLCEDRDIYGNYVSCLQCGYYLTEAHQLLLRYPFGEQRLEPAVVTVKGITLAA